MPDIKRERLARWGTDQRAGLELLALWAVVLVVYLPALAAPWYLDDYSFVGQPGLQVADVLRNFGARRWLVSLSFALNRELTGMTPAGFRLFNILIHGACGSVVYLLGRQIFAAPRPALAVALFFVVHPLQTQAVTYVIQRATSLCGVFFLLALYLFARAVGNEGTMPTRTERVCYGGALLSGVAALYCKEQALVLPGALWLYVALALRPAGGSRRRLALLVLPFAVAPFWLLLQHAVLPLAGGETLAQLTHSRPQAGAGPNTPLHYLVTEFSVLWIYLRLLFVPVGQMLDYGYPVVASLWTVKNGAALAGLLLLGWCAWRLRQIQPLATFAIAWFFLTLAVESSILPLDPLFEHRLYLPVFGFAVVLVDSCRRLTTWPRLHLVLLLLMVMLAGLALRRNLMWNDPVALYEHNYRLAPWHERVRVNLALQYLESGTLAQAEEHLLAVYRSRGGDEAIYDGLGRIYQLQGDLVRARAVLEEGVQRLPTAKKLYNSLGGILLELEEFALAEDALRRAVALDPRFAAALTSLGVAHAAQDEWQSAEEWHRRALAVRSDDPVAHYNLGLALAWQGRLEEALAEQQQAVTLAPRDPDPWDELARLALMSGRGELATRALVELERLAPQQAAAVRQEYGQEMKRR